MPWLAIGSQYYRADGDVLRRQQRSRESLLALRGAVAVNLQFVDEPFDVPGLDNCAVLRRDARTVTRRDGRRKPIVSEMFEALASRATALGCSHFAYLNADIEVTAHALDVVSPAAIDAAAYSRVDRDAAGRDLGVEIRGIDMFVVSTAWWARERHRFRAYVAGEPFWDNVYAAIVAMHGRGVIVSDRPGIFHERHDTETRASPFAEYNGYLAALDAPYFSRWAKYVHEIETATANGRPADPAAATARAFRGRPIGLPERAWHLGRQVRARWRYAATRRQ